MASACCFNYDNIPPACLQISKKLDILSTVSFAQCLSSDQVTIGSLDQVSLIKENMRLEICDLKQKIKAGQKYLKSVKDDLNICKEKIALLEKWEEEFQRLGAVLPVVKKPANAVHNLTAVASSAQIASSITAMNDMTSSKNGIPTFRCIDETEWNAVPSYLKLRFKLDQVNKFVKDLNKELSEKYTLLRKKKSTLNKNALSLRISYEALETAETKSQKLFFVVASDLKKLGLPEKTFSSMRSILRHCRRLREQRNGKTIMLIVT